MKTCWACHRLRQPVGEYSLSLTFEVPQDFEDEGTETLYLKVVSGSIESEITVIIFDTPESL